MVYFLSGAPNKCIVPTGEPRQRSGPMCCGHLSDLCATLFYLVRRSRKSAPLRPCRASCRARTRPTGRPRVVRRDVQTEGTPVVTIRALVYARYSTGKQSGPSSTKDESWKDELRRIEERRKELKAIITSAETEPPAPALHPVMAEVFRLKATELASALKGSRRNKHVKACAGSSTGSSSRLATD